MPHSYRPFQQTFSGEIELVEDVDNALYQSRSWVPPGLATWCSISGPPDKAFGSRLLTLQGSNHVQVSRQRHGLLLCIANASESCDAGNNFYFLTQGSPGGLGYTGYRTFQGVRSSKAMR